MADERNEISVSPDLDYKGPLMAVFLLVGILDHIQQMSLLNRQKNLFKRDASFYFSEEGSFTLVS